VPDSALAAPSTPKAAAGERSSQAQPKQQQQSTAAVSSLPPKDRLRLLAFASCYCPGNELPPLTDELLLAQQEVRVKEQQRREQQQQHRQQPLAAAQQQLDMLLPLQRPAAEGYQQQKQQLLGAALAAAASAGSACTGLFSLGDPQLLLAVLCSCSSASEAEQLLNAALAQHLAAGSGSNGSYSAMQRTLVVAAAAQLMLLAQHQPGMVQQLPTAAADTSRHTSARLPKRQQHLLAVLHAPLGKLQAAADAVLAGQDATACAAGFLARLQQMSDGRQLMQWLPNVESARFFAGVLACACCAPQCMSASLP
jgi:hypothetical protein